MLTDLQTSYVNTEDRIKEQIKDFKAEILQKFNELSKNYEFTSNQMNITATMTHQDMEGFNDKLTKEINHIKKTLKMLMHNI